MEVVTGSRNAWLLWWRFCSFFRSYFPHFLPLLPVLEYFLYLNATPIPATVYGSRMQIVHGGTRYSELGMEISTVWHTIRNKQLGMNPGIHFGQSGKDQKINLIRCNLCILTWSWMVENNLIAIVLPHEIFFPNYFGEKYLCCARLISDGLRYGNIWFVLDLESERHHWILSVGVRCCG